MARSYVGVVLGDIQSISYLPLQLRYPTGNVPRKNCLGQAQPLAHRRRTLSFRHAQMGTGSLTRMREWCHRADSRPCDQCLPNPSAPTWCAWSEKIRRGYHHMADDLMPENLVWKEEMNEEEELRYDVMNNGHADYGAYTLATTTTVLQ
ncbi:unnamed protein product [Clavelina lepadiformis]|uniref:Uncharacterized protein n=1 Tax=Clavelina lepadiformis TaxID=159417 RepID=A0ABP0GZQ0_CLALP